MKIFQKCKALKTDVCHVSFKVQKTGIVTSILVFYALHATCLPAQKWYPSCLKTQCSMNSHYLDCEGVNKQRSKINRASREQRTLLTSWDIQTFKDLQASSDSSTFALNHVPEASLMVTTDSENFTSGLKSHMGGGTDLFGLRDELLGFPTANSLAPQYFA